jgi:oxygen-independent coproporphyrinogen-3 oxidase
LTDGFGSALITEISQKNNFFKNNLQGSLYFPPKTGISDRDKSIVETLYFGGGTPSLLSKKILKRIFDELRSNFLFSKDIEITFEVNPDDVSVEYFKMLLELGATRVSIGVQSLNDEMLKMMNRQHDAAQAKASILNANIAGFTNISIDLIYGLPGLSSDDWRKTLETTFSFPIKHISAYHLTLENGTVFYKWNKIGKIATLNEEESWAQFDILHEMAGLSGFEHYEISSFAKESKYSKHNSNYWNGSSYLGLGPAAHSFDGKYRRWNISNIGKYMSDINNPENLIESEELTFSDKMNEYCMTSLRTKWGMDLGYFKNTFGEENYKRIFEILKKYSGSGHVIFENGKALMTLKGWFISDSVISEMVV